MHAALVEPALGTRLLDWGDGRAVPGRVAVAKTLSVGEAGRLAVCRLRPWLGAVSYTHLWINGYYDEDGEWVKIS